MSDAKLEAALDLDAIAARAERAERSFATEIDRRQHAAALATVRSVPALCAEVRRLLGACEAKDTSIAMATSGMRHHREGEDRAERRVLALAAQAEAMRQDRDRLQGRVWALEAERDALAARLAGGTP